MEEKHSLIYWTDIFPDEFCNLEEAKEKKMLGAWFDNHPEENFTLWKAKELFEECQA